MTHKPANAADRDYQLNLMYRALTNVEDAIADAEAREQQRQTATNAERNERFPAMKGIR